VELTPGPHGGDGARLAKALGIPPSDVLDLSASLNPFAPSVGAMVADNLESLSVYPDERRARGSLSEALGVESTRLVLTNGAAEAISLVASLMPTGSIEEPEFSLYRRHLQEIRSDAPRWQSDPHNPTGALAAADDFATVRDEAFYPLATGNWTRGDRGAVTIGSLTKTFACPGLRMGFVITPDRDTAASLEAIRPRWSLSALGCAVIPELVATAELSQWARSIAAVRADLEQLLAHHQLKAAPSSANYLWIPESNGLRDRLLPTGILLRSGASFGRREATRIAVPDPAGLERLARALATTA
jgi:histidinol-phosphate/aromatic aminotransferase/cobyric acid decarboxylase-like protein